MLLKILNGLHTRFPRFNDVESSFVKIGVPILATSLAMTGAIVGMRQLGLMQGSELAAYDHFVQSQPDRGRDDRLLVVGIDEVDLQTLQEWPISDRTLARLVEKLETYQPRAIGIDVLRDIPIEPGRAELLQTLKRNDNTVVVCKANSAREFGAAPPPGIPIEKVGTADLVIDPGGILRRSLLWMTPPAHSGSVIKKNICNDPNNTLLSLSFNLALIYLQKLKIEPSVTDAGDLKLGSTILPKFQGNMGGYRKADTGGYQILLRYRSPDNPAVQVRLTDVLKGKVDPALLRDRIVLVGYTTPQAKDDFYTPYSSSKDDLQKMPGVLIHAQSASQILSAVIDHQPLMWAWSFPVEAIWILGWSLVGGVLAWYVRHPLKFSLVAVGVIGSIYFISLLTFVQAGWIPVVPAIAAFISTAVGVVLLDRFNHSTYGQTVYKTVKTFLKLEVEVDKEKLEQQVAEITETDYFRDLQNTVKSLRQQNSHPNSQLLSNAESPVHQQIEDNQSVFTLAKPDNSSIPRDSESTHSSDSQNAEDYELDFIEMLNLETKRLKTDLETLSNPSNPENQLGFMQHPRLDRDRPDPVPSEPRTEVQSQQKFTLTDTVNSMNETNDDLDYFDVLYQESQQIKNGKESRTP